MKGGQPLKTRVVVADQSEADFYDLAHQEERLQFVARLEDSAAHLHNRDLKSDRPGRVFDHATSAGNRRGATAHHATGGERDPRKIEAERFAHQVGAALETARQRGEFERLIVMAPPTFLGLLREAIPASLRATVAAEIAKDLVHRTPADVQSHLEGVLHT